MKIIDLGICIDNVDPKGIGRIRCVRYSDYVSEKEKAMSYDPWSDRDPFIAIPFLPSNINYIPEIEQSVKIINYNTEKENVNQEYIAGPFTTSHDFNGQTFSQQVENTSYGVVVKHTPNIFDKNDQYIDKKTESSLAKKKDFAIYGKYGSDILFTENGVQLRGGKLLSKDAASSVNRKKMLTAPIMGKKNSTLTLKKFPKKMTLQKGEKLQISTDVKDLSLIVEYEIDSLTTPTKIDFFIYDVIKSNGEILKTSFFNETTPIPNSVVKLINVNNTEDDPTHTVNITNINNIDNEIRDFIYTLHEDGLGKINPLYKNHRKNKELTHPFFFRPSENFINLTGNTSEISFKNDILNNVRIYNVGPKSGLIWSILSIRPTTKTKKVKVDNIILDNNSPEQTFSSLKSDKIYLLSTDTNETNKKINFTSLDSYEYTQEDFIKGIDPNTYSTVRGENLLALLQAMVLVLFNHQHNLTKPMVKIGYSEYDKLVELLKSMENDLLNKSIRIN